MIFNKENTENPKFEIDDHVQISKYNYIFAKCYVPNWSEEVFVIKNTVPWTYFISDLNSEGIIGTFYETVEKVEKNEKKKELKR